MRIIVTGAAGFVGARVAASLLDGGHEVWCPFLSNVPERGHSIRCDLTNRWDVQQLIRWADPEAIVHLAGIPTVKTWGAEVTRANVLTTHQLLEHAPRGVRFVLASSASVYGRSDVPWVDEENDALPCSPYGASKLAAELLLRTYATERLVVGAALRPVAVVGGGATHGLVPDLVKKLRSDDPELRLLGVSPGSVKPFVHASDAANAFCRAAFINVHPDFYCLNVSNRESISVADVAEIAMDELGIRKPVKWADNFAGDALDVSVSTSRANAYGMAPLLSSGEAVRLAVKEVAEWPS